MNLLARSDLKAAFGLAKTAIGQFNASVTPQPGLGNVAEAVERLCHVIQALDEEMEELRRMKPHGVYPDEHL